MKYPYIFFGSSRLSLIVVEALCKAGISPLAIVTTTDKPKGRKLILTPPEVKIFGQEHNIPVLQFEKLNENAVTEIGNVLKNYKDLQTSTENIKDTLSAKTFFLVASYGLIIPQSVLDLPEFGTLNIHPSLLPAYRGASPLQQALIDDVKDTGVTIMLMDAKMDHGPIILQEKRHAHMADWPKLYPDFESELALQGTRMIIDNISEILDGSIVPKEQDHGLATFTKKFQKTDGLLDINKLAGPEGYQQFLRFNALYEWPGTYFFAKLAKKNDDVTETDIRVKITAAHWDAAANLMEIEKVIPEGQKETLWSEFRKKIV